MGQGLNAILLWTRLYRGLLVSVSGLLAELHWCCRVGSVLSLKVQSLHSCDHSMHPSPANDMKLGECTLLRLQHKKIQQHTANMIYMCVLYPGPHHLHTNLLGLRAPVPMHPRSLCWTMFTRPPAMMWPYVLSRDWQARWYQGIGKGIWCVFFKFKHMHLRILLRIRRSLWIFITLLDSVRKSATNPYSFHEKLTCCRFKNLYRRSIVRDVLSGLYQKVEHR